MTTPPMPDSADRNARPDVEGRSVGDLVGEIADDLSRLVRKEIDLAKTEAKQEVTKLGKGAGMLAGAGLAAHLVLLFLSVALMLVLGRAMDLDLAALLVAIVWVVVAAVLASVGRRQLKSFDPKLEQTTETLKEDVQWAKTLKD
jgi:uncharacterized membrane protein YqjE